MDFEGKSFETVRLRCIAPAQSTTRWRRVVFEYAIGTAGETETQACRSPHSFRIRFEHVAF